ncbi:GNAT family N-acetyltransferase [Streptomyces sp. NRRL F-5135]|uniref:GNAT family N-acetyltransferase n=1 Tax=Streptomyces sp. NRRL F-5135 TaxID=1463858 RepID=UPI00068AFE95|nr:GNAT family N-acetyltransferase [Streptomyces sp. NRRL F-5135]
MTAVPLRADHRRTRSRVERPADRELIAFNTSATGAADRGSFSVKVTDEAGELVGGLAAWTWGGPCGIELLWVREDSREDGWGSKIIRTAEAEARRRGCDRVAVSSFTFQAPGFYQRHGYVETGRTLGIPGGYADVHMFKSPAWDSTSSGRP